MDELRAIFIDVEKQTVEEILIANDIRTIQKKIDCGIFERVRFDDTHCVYIDDEGILPHRYKGLRFMMNSYPSAIAGNGLILADSADGINWASCEESKEYYLSGLALFLKDIQPDGY